MNDLARLIQEQRIASGYTSQRAFAEAIGKIPDWVSRLERGAAKELPPPEDLEAVARVTGLTIEEMLAAAGYRVGAGPLPVSAAVERLRPRIDRVAWDEKAYKVVESVLDTLAREWE